MTKQTSYNQQLKHGKWAQRRLEIMQRDGFRCSLCGSQKRLQVHHRVYFKRREVWQYQDNELTTFCDPCHFRNHFNKPITPAKIWEGIEDRKKDPIQEKILKLQEKLKEPISEELQIDILRHIILLQKGGKNG